MTDVQIAITDQQDTQITLAVPGIQGIQGPIGPIGPSGATGLSGVTPTFSISGVTSTTASGANVTISGGPDYALYFALPSQSLVLAEESGVTYSVSGGDNGKVLNFTASGSTIVTFPSGLPIDFSCSVVRTGSGNVTVSGASGVSLFTSSNTLQLAKQYSVVAVFAISSDTFVVTGDLAV